MKLDETLLKIATYKHDLGSTNKICKFQDATQTPNKVLTSELSLHLNGILVCKYCDIFSMQD